MSTGDFVSDSGSGLPDRQDETSAAGGARLVTAFRLGERQEAGPLVVYPIFVDEQDGSAGAVSFAPRYITLGQGLREGSVEIAEVTWAGSIPKVRVANRGEAPVLWVDGEEVLGARQNRVPIASVLVERLSDLVVPVACTEKARWAYASRTFADSGVMAERGVRWAVRDSVNESLRAGAGAHVDQSRVWDEVDDLHRRQGTWSPTGAMRDAYEGRRRDLDRLLAAFPSVDGQNGVLVLHGPRVVGLDVVSQAPQYAELHDKLLRSYAFEALVTGGEPGDVELAEEFLDRVAGLRGEPFPGVGLGRHVRYEGEGVLGSAVISDGEVVHAAFADATGAGSAAGRERSSGSRQRSVFADIKKDARWGNAASARKDRAKRAMRDREDARRAGELADSIMSRPHLELVVCDVPYGHMGATLADAVLQGGLRYERLSVPEEHRLRRRYPTARTTSAFDVLLESAEPLALLGWSDEQKVRRLRSLTQLLIDSEVERENDLLAWLDSAGAKVRLTAIEGVGQATFQYLRFLAGAEDAAAVDRWFWRILDGARVRTYGFNDALGVYREAAALLGVSLATLEYSLWRYGMARRWRP